ncbi:MAG: YkvA family protein, partial [Thermomicrobiales bacterium]
LISDPIPIIGYLDDLILVPLGVALAVKLMPAAVWADAQGEARTALRTGKPTNKIAAAIWIGSDWRSAGFSLCGDGYDTDFG